MMNSTPRIDHILQSLAEWTRGIIHGAESEERQGVDPHHDQYEYYVHNDLDETWKPNAWVILELNIHSSLPRHFNLVAPAVTHSRANLFYLVLTSSACVHLCPPRPPFLMTQREKVPSFNTLRKKHVPQDLTLSENPAGTTGWLPG